MDQIIQQIGSTIGGFFDSAPVRLGLQAIAIYFVILWLAAAYWAFRDMQLRSENPILPYLAASFIIVFTPIFLIGWLAGKTWRAITLAIAALKVGFLDGKAGLTYALLSSYYVWLKFMKLRDLEKQ